MASDENQVMAENIIEMTDEQGTTVQFEHLLTFEYGEYFYVALLPVEKFEGFEEGEVLLMRLEETEDESIFTPVETEEELEGAWNAFLEIYYEDDDEEQEDE